MEEYERFTRTTVLKRLFRHGFLKLNSWFFENQVQKRIVGVQYVPVYRSYIIVAAPHQSHIDTGFVTFALRALVGRTRKNTVRLAFGRPLYPIHMREKGAFTAKAITQVAREALQDLEEGKP